MISLTFWLTYDDHQSAIVDYGNSNERRHGARITPQAERPIAALEGLELPGSV